MKRFSEVSFASEFVANFPGDTSSVNVTKNTPGALYALVQPTPSPSPHLLCWSENLAEKFQFQKPLPNSRDLDLLSGNYTSPNMKPYSACYGGHQFGRWAGQLGDGRAITLGEVLPGFGAASDQSCSWELQLKGAGRTPYSRRGDGFAVLRSSVREFLMSEAFYYLNIPTTRALSLVATGREVLRDLLYDGNPRYEPGAIVTRMAPSFLRFGNYEMLASRGELSLLKQLIHWTISKYFPDIEANDPRAITQWYKEVSIRTAQLMVEWCRVGFVHGVMNTDNMSILGLTIDYGPYAMMEEYDPQFTPNTTDLPGRRYAFMRQPAVALWNLERLAEALMSLHTKEVSGTTLELSQEDLSEGLELYETTFIKSYKVMMAGKLGLGQLREGDENLLKSLDEVLSFYGMDMTLFYVRLTELALRNLENDIKAEEWASKLLEVSYKRERVRQSDLLVKWVIEYKARIEADHSIDKMSDCNPKFILRNFQLQEAIEEMEESPSNSPGKKFEDIFCALKAPYQYQEHLSHLYVMRPDWAKNKPGCSQLSCSS